jgi:cell division protein FtsL
MGRYMLGFLALIIAIAGLAIWYVWQGWQITDLQSKVIASRLELAELLAKRDRLQLEVIRAWSLENIERIAKERLGMKKIPPKTLKLPRK